MYAQTSTTSYDDYLNEQLINCLNLQTNVIQNLSQYSQHISLQLIEIKNNVEILANRVMTLQHQSHLLPSVQIHIPPSNPLFFSLPSNLHEFMTQPVPYAFSDITDQQPSRAAPFVFGSIMSSNVNHSDDDVDDENDSDEGNIPFKPVVHLSPVELKTGEEDENILFCERAKLYRFDSSSNQMKERGTGEMKILQHKTTKRYRILMRREYILKLCANHKITSQMELNPHPVSPNTYIWSAMDYSDGEAKHETLCVKFKTDEQAGKFSKIFNEAKTKTDDFPLIGKISLNDDDVILEGEVKPTKEQIEKARKLQLPPTFYLYENKEPCKGCRGCTEDLASILSSEIQYGNRLNPYDAAAAAVLENLSNFPSGFFPNSSLPSLMSMVPTWFPDGVDSYPPFNMPSPPKDYRMIIKAKRCLPSNRLPPPTSYPDYEQTSFDSSRGDDVAATPTHQKKSRNFSGNTTDPYALNNYASQVAQNILDRVKQELYKQIQIVTIKEDQKPTSQFDNNKPSISANSTTSIFGNLTSVNTNNSGFSFANFGNTTGFQFSTPISSTTTDTSPTFKFGNKATLNFSDLVKQTSDIKSTTDDNEKRVFPGQGSLIFGTSTTEKNNDDEDNSYEPSFAFKPIVHLSPVEVKTGEEDENILFREHAKLYRFDSPSNEMKERGKGEMKILQHKTTNRCRVLMRRDQVFNVCANHKITSEMELKDHHGKENAYIWSAIDYADGVSKHETLCVRFKTNDQAKRFFQQFNDAKKINANIQQ